MNNEQPAFIKKLLENLPSPDELGLNKPTEGLPIHKEANIRYPEAISQFLRSRWPGTPFPRKIGEAVMPFLPVGLGEGVLQIVKRLGL